MENGTKQFTNNRGSRVIVLAAGKGSRMKSELPKVLHIFKGKPMISYAIAAAQEAGDAVTVVTGHGAELVEKEAPEGVDIVRQPEQKGTGDAVRCAVQVLGQNIEEAVAVIPGDHPRLSGATLSKLIQKLQESGSVLALATVKLTDFADWRSQFTECGRIIRNEQDQIVGIVEFKDATDEQKTITEVNVSCYAFYGPWLRDNVAELSSSNAAGEFYLTDLIEKAFATGHVVSNVVMEDAREGMGINTPEQMQNAETA